MSASKKIAIVSADAKLGSELKGATRYVYLAERLSAAGYQVDFITASFQHWEKRQRDVSHTDYQAHSFNLVFLDEPSYPNNMCVQRIWAHHVLARRVAAYFKTHTDYNLIYCQIPPNDVTRAAGRAAHRLHIPFVVDVNDVWPEAFEIAFSVPVLSRVLFAPFAAQARAAYQLANAVVGTSEEYTHRAFQDRAEDIPKRTVYVGNDLAVFDAGAAQYAASVIKPDDEFWVSYAGNISKLYDLSTLVLASVKAASEVPGLKVKLLGDGPTRAELEALIGESGAPAECLGYMPYEQMAAYLVASDVVVNSLVAHAPQSVPTKIGDYLASGSVLVNTSLSPEFCAKVTADGFGVNVYPGDVDALARVLVNVARDDAARARMSTCARHVAEAEFDRASSYTTIVELIDELVGGPELDVAKL
ncbi:glycosyltransferase [Collinsella sp. zg1085]|uniref:glycosyltransferase n=1 Tax=Collinsella sp. zg1085 TaxID=2844380 RepID=UPI001C0C329D|nr:glycosyltransferase [Collinsella sp. zg1085]QWT18123.1 glycosyltransferase [Collinsella sp. zg1085]